MIDQATQSDLAIQDSALPLQAEPAKAEQNQTAKKQDLDTPENEKLNAEASKKEIHQVASPEEKAQTEKQKAEETSDNPIIDFISGKLVKFTTIVATAINIFSAPIRLFDNANPIKKFINGLSMGATKAHQLVYAASGLDTGVKNKNPLLLASYTIEGLSALMGLRKIYLLRGLATALDAIPAGLEKRLGGLKFASYSEGLKKTYKGFKEVLAEFVKNPFLIASGENGAHMAVVSSLITSIGVGIGMTFNDKLGGSIRDGSGAAGDLSLVLNEDKDARESGFFYLVGSIFDFIARYFDSGLAHTLGIQNVDAFSRLRDFSHELALGLDRIGQYLFLRYNQKEQELEKKPVANELAEIKHFPGLDLAAAA